MTIRYPNGRKYTPLAEKGNTKLKKTTTPKDLSFSNRGKSLEDEIDEANNFYLAHNIAVIHKKPVPIQIVNVEYPSRSAAVIREAYFRTPSTTDYNGVYKGAYIDFDAKDTKNKTSFPLKNVHSHQISHMREVASHKGVCFLLIRFSSLQRYFILPFQVVDRAWTNMENGERKSIPLEVFEKEGYEIKIGYSPQINYLQAIAPLLPQ